MLFNSIYTRLSIYLLTITAVLIKKGFTSGNIVLSIVYLLSVSYLEYSRYVSIKRDENFKKEMEELVKSINKEE